MALKPLVICRGKTAQASETAKLKKSNSRISHPKLVSYKLVLVVDFSSSIKGLTKTHKFRWAAENSERMSEDWIFEDLTSIQDVKKYLPATKEISIKF